MKNGLFLLLLLLAMNPATKIVAQYNTLWIPDTLSGTAFNLIIKDTFAQMRTGNQTITGGINNNKFWGPTMFFNKGDTVRMNIKNKLNDSSNILD